MKYTVARYNGVGERPLVILIDHSTTRGDKFEDIISLKEELKGKIIYNVYDSNDLSINGIDNWNGGEINWDKLSKL